VTEQQALAMDTGRSAVISADGVYRYRLERCWRDGDTVAWIMLNPSTADADTDDPTLRRITAFSRGWGFGRLIVANLYALRATDPGQLWTAPDPVGPDNDRHIADAVSCHEVIVAWGTNAKPERVVQVLDVIGRQPGVGHLHCLGVTKSGAPKHPLYVAGNTPMTLWRGAS
jgi:hypothetical protein